MRYLQDEQPGAEFYLSPCRPYGQGADGYGRKIATRYVVRYAGRTRRVYCCCYSNAGTLYVIDRGDWLVVDSIPPLPATP
jgi:hypothetical protein